MSTRQAPPVKKGPAWSEISSKLNPMLSKEEYDSVRRKYFQDVVRPHIPKDQHEGGIWEEFKKRTEREPLLTSTERLHLRATVAASSAAKAFADPLHGVNPQFKALSEASDEVLQSQLPLAKREGMSVGAEMMGGALVGELPAVIASFAAAQPIAGALVAKAGLTATRALRAKEVLAGGLSFGAIDAAKEQDGSRFVAGVKGFGVGMLWTLPILPFLKAEGLAKTTGEAQELLRKAIQEPASVPEVIQEKIAEQVMKESKILRTQEVLPNSIVRNPNVKGVTIAMLPKEGTGVLNIELKAGRESDALHQIRLAQMNGAQFDSIHFNPNDEARAFKFMRESRDSEIWKYEDGMLIEVKKGLAEQKAKEIQKELGVPASAVSDSHVELQVKRAVAPAEDDLLGQLEGSVSKVETDKLPEGVSFLGKQYIPKEAGGGDDVYTNMYHYKLPDGEVTTFTVEPGGDIPAKVAKVKEKWAKFDSGEATVSPRMTLEEAENLVRGAGRDPAKADLEAVRNLGREEFERLLEVTKKTRAAGAEFDPLGNWLEKVAAKGAVKQASITLEDLIPMYRKRTEIGLPSQDGGDVAKGTFRRIVSPRMKISLHPFRASVEVPEAIFEKLNPGAKAALYSNWREALQKVGIRLPEGPNELYPAVMFTKSTRPEEKYHEFIHAAIVKAGLHESFENAISREGRLHAFSIASHLEKHSVYGEYPFRNLVNEAFTYAATAIRYGKTEYGKDLMGWLTEINGTEEQLKWFVQETAENILEMSQGKVDAVSERILQRKMVDLIRRSDQNITYGITSSGASARWNPDSLGWQIVGEDGEAVHLRNVEELWDYLNNSDVSDIGPSFTSGLEQLGVRGPMFAVSNPGSRLATPTVGLGSEEKWVGWSAVSGWFRPFLPWVSSLDTKINSALAKKGEGFKIFEAVKNVDDQVRGADEWLSGKMEGLSDILKGTPDKKLHDFFSVLTYKPEEFGQAASKYGLAAGDLEKVKKLEEWFTQFRDDTHIQPFEWLREMYPKFTGYGIKGLDTPEALRHLGWQTHYDAKSAGFWEKAVREKELQPGDTHVGRFAYWLMREGYEKKFIGEPLKELSKLLNTTVKDASGIERSFLPAGLRWPLENYVKYVQGIPDQTQQVVNRGMKDFVGHLQGKIKAINANLPSGFKIPGSEANISPRLLQRLMTLTYASALGLRPAVAVRDGLQVLSTSLPVLGGRKFSRGMELMFSKDMRKIAEDAGVFITKSNIGEQFGNILGEIPMEGKISQAVNDMANVMMAPSRWGDNFARGITFLGEYDASLKAIKKLRAGTLTQDKFLQETSAWFLDDQMASKLLVEAQQHGIDAKEVAKKIALETVDLTQWPFRRGTQPAVLRTGLGRIFGQFGRWPANYADFLGRIYQKSKGGAYRGMALKTAGLWMASNYAASKGMESLGADVSTWFFVSPTGYSASPHLDLVMNMLKSPENSDDGRAARRKVLEYPLNFIPARIEMENILNSMENMPPGTGLMDPQLLEILGFRPRKREPEISAEDLAGFEMGFGKNTIR